MKILRDNYFKILIIEDALIWIYLYVTD